MITCECGRCGHIARWTYALAISFGMKHLGCGGVYRPLEVRSRDDGNRRPWKERWV